MGLHHRLLEPGPIPVRTHPRPIWGCKVGTTEPLTFETGADAPMRAEVHDAFTIVTGTPPEFIFSGWGEALDESELAVVENREPSAQRCLVEAADQLVAIQTRLAYHGLTLENAISYTPPAATPAER